MTRTRRVPIRRGQLIRPFGVGSLVVGPDGTSLITAGLDHWYEREDGSHGDPAEFKVTEWRLQASLGVSHFRLPPDLRWQQAQESVRNTGLRIPMLRFPQWHYCPSCRRLQEWPLTHSDAPECSCSTRGRQPQMLQVRFVAMCPNGHLFDFPWREWVHRDLRPTCSATMRLRATGLVECDCGNVEPRSLRYVTQSPGLSLQDGQTYRCPGRTPWLGSDGSHPCDQDATAALRSSTNIYFANTRSSIYVPRSADVAPGDLVQRLEEPPLSDLIELVREAGRDPQPSVLRGQYGLLLDAFTDAEIEAALGAMSDEGGDVGDPDAVIGEDRETTFRRAEFALLRKTMDHLELATHQVDADAYGDLIHHGARGVTLVHRLRVTEVLTGFSRVEPEEQRLTGSPTATQDAMRLLWKEPPHPRDSWLPANVVYGEGIFIEFNELVLRSWEQRDDVQRRGQALSRNYTASGERQPPGWLSPRYVLLHTFAHMIINRLTFEAGYSSAALRERLYVSASPEAPMAGVLVYTAAGDSDGTLGGLVRLGRPEHLERIVSEALDRAIWCSADPVCAELADAGGQGPDSCNLAACHSCGLLPETACETGNRFLDRALVVRGVGDTGSADVGFFMAPGTTTPA